jgi:hypothetical protein
MFNCFDCKKIIERKRKYKNLVQNNDVDSEEYLEDFFLCDKCYINFCQKNKIFHILCPCCCNIIVDDRTISKKYYISDNIFQENNHIFYDKNRNIITDNLDNTVEIKCKLKPKNKGKSFELKDEGYTFFHSDNSSKILCFNCKNKLLFCYNCKKKEIFHCQVCNFFQTTQKLPKYEDYSNSFLCVECANIDNEKNNICNNCHLYKTSVDTCCSNIQKKCIYCENNNWWDIKYCRECI